MNCTTVTVLLNIHRVIQFTHVNCSQKLHTLIYNEIIYHDYHSHTVKLRIKASIGT